MIQTHKRKIEFLRIRKPPAPKKHAPPPHGSGAAATAPRRSAQRLIEIRFGSHGSRGRNNFALRHTRRIA